MAIDLALFPEDVFRVAVRGTSDPVTDWSMTSFWNRIFEENCRCGTVMLVMRSIEVVACDFVKPLERTARPCEMVLAIDIAVEQL